MNEEKISVIVPIYNVEKYLIRCLESIVNQTYKNLEIILVDDGSTDNCGKIIDQYKKKDNRIKIIHKMNGGLSDARNKGIEIATGDYISFIDSDDFIAMDMLDYLFKLLKQNNSDISVCNFKTFSEVEELNDIEENSNIVKNYSGIEMLQILLKGNISYGDYAWNKLYSSRLFKDVRYPLGKKMEDIGTTYKLYLKAKKVSIGSKKKYYYYKRSDSILGKNDLKIYQDSLELSKERLEFLKKKNIDIDFSEYNIDLICKIIELYKNCKTKNSKKYFYDKSYDILLEKLLKENKIANYVSLKQFIKIKILHICIKVSRN